MLPDYVLEDVETSDSGLLVILIFLYSCWFKKKIVHIFRGSKEYLFVLLEGE
jgi:hypothetical protein